MQDCRLVAIYNCFADSSELLPYSLNCIKGHVQEVIIVYQEVSNFGERLPFEKFSDNFIENIFCDTVFTYVRFEPNLKLSGMKNETNKRNLGLTVAKQRGCTHYLQIDQDELWYDFALAKKEFLDSGAKSSVAQMYTYFKKPTLRFESVDNYYIPFISVLNSDSKVGNYSSGWYCDPTRKSNETDVVLISEKCHHFSWVRKDISLKVRNSSARENILKSKLMRDYHDPNVGEGFYVADFKQKLVETPNIFNIEI